MQALNRLSLEARTGEVLGFLGPKGAGKTTTMRLLMGYLRRTAASARVHGLDCWRDSVAVHARTGYLPGEVRLWPKMSTAGGYLGVELMGSMGPALVAVYAITAGSAAIANEKNDMTRPVLPQPEGCRGRDEEPERRPVSSTGTNVSGFGRISCRS